MPNHIITRLNVSGPNTNVRNFIDAANGDLSVLDFSKLRPIPADCNDWYNWILENWGTKWNACLVGVWKYQEDDENIIATLRYLTAWAPATILLLYVSKSYPNLQFMHEFVDECKWSIGDQTIMNGEIIQENDYDWNSVRAVALRHLLGLSCYDEGSEESEEVEQ